MVQKRVRTVSQLLKEKSRKFDKRESKGKISQHLEVGQEEPRERDTVSIKSLISPKFVANGGLRNL